CREYGIELKPKGKDHFASCPWHEDSDPSFSVTPGKNLWNCLGGCGGGDNIQLVMRCEKISFRRAAEKLAARADCMNGCAPRANAAYHRPAGSNASSTTPMFAARRPKAIARGLLTS
ncbi:MAG: hypothetical protein HC788_13170, partial [Sphingopyxis sp.]|nr:hypothetical protein [Sphingopyxis sp.]